MAEDLEDRTNEEVNFGYDEIMEELQRAADGQTAVGWRVDAALYLLMKRIKRIEQMIGELKLWKRYSDE